MAPPETAAPEVAGSGTGDPAPALSFPATYFDGQTSRAHSARVQVQARGGSGLWLLISGEAPALAVQAASVTLDPPLGRQPRTLHLPGGGRLIGSDLAAVSELERQLGRNRGLRMVERLERRWPVALGSLLAVVAFILLFLRFGLPLLATLAAQLTPPAVLASLDRQTAAIIEQQEIRPSRLSPARQRQLQQEFLRQVASEVPGRSAYQFQLRLRSSGDIGANAFALPGGTVYLTDDLVRLAKNDRELLGVLAHESGHVRHRHALQQLYQGVGLTLMGSAVLGDVTGAASLAAALPAVLLRSGYSRAAETQADDDAGHWLMRHYGTTRPLRDILTRLSSEGGGRPGVLDLLADHPGTPQRIAHLEAIERAEKGTVVPGEVEGDESRPLESPDTF